MTFPDGSPAPWIRVEAMASGGRPGTPEGWQAQGRATTAADGSYEMELMPGVSYTIKVADNEGTGPGTRSASRSTRVSLEPDSTCTCSAGP